MDAIKLCTDIYGPKRIKSDDFGDNFPRILLPYAAVMSATHHPWPYWGGGTSQDGSDAEDRFHSVFHS